MRPTPALWAAIALACDPLSSGFEAEERLLFRRAVQAESGLGDTSSYALGYMVRWDLLDGTWLGAPLEAASRSDGRLELRLYDPPPAAALFSAARAAGALTETQRARAFADADTWIASGDLIVYLDHSEDAHYDPAPEAPGARPEGIIARSTAALVWVEGRMPALDALVPGSTGYTLVGVEGCSGPVDARCDALSGRPLQAPPAELHFVRTRRL